MYYKDPSDSLFYEPSSAVIVANSLLAITEQEFNDVLAAQQDPHNAALNDYKEAAKTQLRAGCKEQITSNFFQSDAHTVGYEYDCRDSDQSNLQLAIQGATNSGGNRDVYAHNGVEFIAVAHTLTQLQGVADDMEVHIASKRAALYTAINLINAAADHSAVDAIVSGVVW